LTPCTSKAIFPSSKQNYKLSLSTREWAVLLPTYLEIDQDLVIYIASISSSHLSSAVYLPNIINPMYTR